MPPYKVLFLCDDCVASAPVLEALRIGGFRLRIVHSFIKSACIPANEPMSSSS
jgi:hypothetical protein